MNFSRNAGQWYQKIINLCGFDLFVPTTLALSEFKIANENSHMFKCWAKTKTKKAIQKSLLGEMKMLTGQHI